MSLNPDQIPTTGRKVEFQVKQIGFSSVAELAESLPENATIIDIGAGLSRLGHQVGVLRRDIHWINIDPSYAKQQIIKEAQKDLPENVELFTEDILKASTNLSKLKGKADIAYSYWLVPHLSLESDSDAEQAIKQMRLLLKPEGRLIVGPIRHWGVGLLSPIRYRGTSTYSRKDITSKVIEDIVADTKIWWLPRKLGLFFNRHNIHLFIWIIGGKNKK